MVIHITLRVPPPDRSYSSFSCYSDPCRWPLSVKFLQKNEVNNEVLRTVKVTLGSINFTILPMFLDVQKRNRRLMPATPNLRHHVHALT